MTSRLVLHARRSIPAHRIQSTIFNTCRFSIELLRVKEGIRTPDPQNHNLVL